MNKYLDELESDLIELERRVNYVKDSFCDVEEEFEKMEEMIDDINTIIIEDEFTAEEKINKIKIILAR